ncbi:hypothetical protein [Mucilaginibacter gynuensis]
MQTSALFAHNYNTSSHVVVNQGGTSSGKTYSILQVLFCFACRDDKQVITVVGQDIPNLKAGALRDAADIYHSSKAIISAVKNFNKTDRLFEFYNGSVIEFKSYDNGQDAKSGKRDYLFVNEANGIDWTVYTELALRTKKRIREMQVKQDAQTRISEIRLKVLEGQVAILQQEVEKLKTNTHLIK